MDLELEAIDGHVDVDRGLATAALLMDGGFRYEAAQALLLVLESRIGERSTLPVVLEHEMTELHELAAENGMIPISQRVEAMAATARIPLKGTTVAIPAPAEASVLPHHLTDREVEVMALLAEGLTNKAIGEQLYVSPRTVSTHVSNLLAKLGASTRGEAAAAYHRLGLGEIVDLREQADTRATVLP